MLTALSDLLVRHQTVALFLVVLAEQSGVPIPATPALLGLGASKAGEPLQFTWAIVVATVAALGGDLIWYGLGRRYGRPMLGAICRVSLEPASCAKRATEAFGRRGPQLLLFAKFIPGVSTTAPTLAALFGVSTRRFLLWDAAGSALWAATFMAVGALFRSQIADVLSLGRRLGASGLAVALLLLAAYAAMKALNRHRFVRRLRVSRITPAELATLMESGAPVTIADLRHDLDVAAAGASIPGAVRISPADLAERRHSLPAGHDVVVYCSCPDEATSASIALRLRAQGVDRIRPLAGGFDGWRAAGLPLAHVPGATPGAETPAGSLA